MKAFQLLTLSAVLLAPSLYARAAEKPDILFLMPDQMRGDCLSALGHPVVRTPQLDELARQGILFRRAYSTVPSCIPARYALLTGTSPQASGIVGYGARPITTPTLPGLLADAGYATVLVGRNMHQQSASGTCGYQKQVLGSTYVSDDDYDTDLKKAAQECGGIRNVIAKLGLNCNLWPAAPWPLPDDLHPTAWIVRQSRQVVNATPAAKPLFLTASFYAPHPPLFPPKKFFDALLKKELPRPAHGDWVDWAALSPTGDKGGHRVRLEGEPLRRAQAGYFGLIEHLDEQFGPLIADFKARSEKAGRAWVIVVSSDHGELLGDHGYFRKCEPYEGAANIPFVICGSPSLGFKAGGRCDQPVCLEDILPTLAELAHINRPKSADGVSLVSVLRGTGRVTRDWLHFEHAPCYSKAQAFHALTDGHFKYIWRPTDCTEQLFDLDRDPREERDLSKLPAVKQWRQRLIQRLAGRPEGFSDGQRLVPERPYPAVQKK
ncbi:MAG: sulfatase-like hydrolase/transferase [Verrucomicrobiia bacterium]|jgi:arylsulfatase A-like enzyme